MFSQEPDGQFINGGKKTENEKTWVNFKHEFTEAHRDIINQRSTQTNPFQQANAVIEQFQKRTEAILEHVTNSTMNTSTISTLTTQNQTLTDQLAKSQQIF